MDRYRYFIFNQRSVLVLGILQVVCAGLCVVCGFMDAVFRKDTPLSSTRTPVWGGLVMACPGVLALFASQRKHSVLVSVMVAAAGLSCVAVLFLSGYSCLTLTYGEEDEEVFHHHDSPEVVTAKHSGSFINCFLLRHLTLSPHYSFSQSLWYISPIILDNCKTGRAFLKTIFVQIVKHHGLHVKASLCSIS
uniref:Zgc:113425 n=1 Tax=Amphiprion percula TaxID=161767 RepID=A0A3P8S2E6_AMPPE